MRFLLILLFTFTILSKIYSQEDSLKISKNNYIFFRINNWGVFAPKSSFAYYQAKRPIYFPFAIGVNVNLYKNLGARITYANNFLALPNKGNFFSLGVNFPVKITKRLYFNFGAEAIKLNSKGDIFFDGNYVRNTIGIVLGPQIRLKNRYLISCELFSIEYGPHKINNIRLAENYFNLNRYLTLELGYLF